MALTTLAELTIAAAARELKADIHDINTPTARIFMEDQNMKVEPGDRIQLNILYKDENSQIVSSGDNTIEDGIIDPFIHGHLPWSYRVTSFTEDDINIEKNLGGVSIAQLADSSNIMSRVPAGSRNTLVNMLAPRFKNMNMTHRKRMAEDFFVHNVDEDGNTGPVGIDQITTPNTTYAGLAHTALGALPFTSDLLKSAGQSGEQQMWNPLTVDIGSSNIEWSHFVDAATDLNKGAQFALEMPASGAAWNCFCMSTRFYNNAPFMQDYLDRRRSNSSDDVEMGPTMAIKDSRLRAKFYCDPNQQEDGTVYFWKEGALKKYMQRRQSFADNIQVTKAWNQDRVLFRSRYGYQYGTNARWMCGKITSTDPF